jgi:hypothetical protein
MRLYPEVADRRIGTLARDGLVLALLLLFGWLGKQVHDAVDALAVLGEGVRSAREAVQGGFDSAADAVDGTPVVGDDLADGLREAGGASGGNVADLGREGEDTVHDLALLLGLLTFGIPSVLLLMAALPPRIAQIRRLTAAGRVLAEPVGERRRLLAMRAAFGLPYGQLLQHTADPIGDLAAGRYDALVDAVMEDAGLRVPSRQAPAAK